MNKKELAAHLRDFKLETTGCACYIRPVSGRPFCANGLTEQQAKDFGVQHHLKFVSWNAGKSCTEVGCG